MIIKDKNTGAYVGIKCDVPECITEAPPSAEIMQGHGLNNMGWKCSGGTHLCPKHSEQLR